MLLTKLLLQENRLQIIEFLSAPRPFGRGALLVHTNDIMSHLSLLPCSYMKNSIIALALFTSVLIPAAVFAETRFDTPSSGVAAQEKIRALQGQVESLLVQIRTLQSNYPTHTAPSNPATPPRPTVMPTWPSACKAITHTLSFGSRGEDVETLQRFLSVTGDYTHGEITGYFGKATQEAVQRLQQSGGIEFPVLSTAYGYGMVGPQTMGIVNRFCGNGPTFTVSPRKGSAPLTVSFGVSASTSVAASIDFGDGETSAACVATPTSKCAPTQHTYQKAGTYIALLRTTSGTTTVAKQTIVVLPTQTSGTGAPSISGIDAPATLAVGEVGTWTVKASLPNDATGNLSYSVVWGDESTIDKLREAAGMSAPSNVQTSATFTHAYSRAGFYKPIFTVRNGTGSAQVSASVTVTNDPITTNTLKASPTSGMAPLVVVFSGVVNSINFGDGSSSVIFDRTTPSSLSHTYTTPGTYVAKSGTSSVTITVAAVTAGDYLGASPMGGQVPVTISFTPATNKNFFGGTYIDFGDGSRSTGNLCIPSTINKCAPITHTYQRGGSYQAKLIGIGEGTNTEIASVTIHAVTEESPLSSGPSDAQVASVLRALEEALEKALAALQ